MRSIILFSLFLFGADTICVAQLKTTKTLGLLAKVVKVIDGDTVDVTEKDSTYRLRLYGIDAPERGQTYYHESKELMEELVLNKEVVLQLKEKDRYGRWVAVIMRRADKVNINYQMVKMGMAWHFIKYCNDPELARLEVVARQKELGLWSQYYYLEPWEYRKSKN